MKCWNKLRTDLNQQTNPSKCGHMQGMQPDKGYPMLGIVHPALLRISLNSLQDCSYPLLF